FFPGVIYHLTLWIPAHHRGRAISRFYVAGPLASAVMGAVAGGLLGLEGHLGLAGWQWLFLVQGMPAIAMSLIFLLYLPDVPATAKWLSPDEKRWLEGRLDADRAITTEQGEHTRFKALRDPRVLAFVALNFMTLGAYYAFNLSAPTVLQTATGMSAGRIGFFVSIAGLMGAVAMIFNGWHSDLRRERYLHLAAPLLVQGACFAVMATTHVPTVMLTAYMVLITANWASAAVIWLVPGEILDPRSVAVAVAAINGIGQLGSFVMPYAWGLAKDATGDFHAGLAALTAPYLIAVAIVLVLRQGHRRRRLAVA
ncbi:MAG TPA: MFS transporter, partial [Phenylobacterium sp.]